MKTKPEIRNDLKNLQVVMTQANKPDSAMPSRLQKAAKRRLLADRQAGKK